MKPEPRVGEHPHAARIRALFAAFHARDLATIREALAPDAVWHFPGRDGRLAGSHVGHAAIFGFLARVTELTEGTFELQLEQIIANDTHAVAFFRGRGKRLDRVLDNPTCLKIRMQDGRAVEIHEFVWDLFAVDAFWS
jgi:ketosteroid isomerase-like protein